VASIRKSEFHDAYGIVDCTFVSAPAPLLAPNNARVFSVLSQLPHIYMGSKNTLSRYEYIETKIMYPSTAPRVCQSMW
jgi:hypothetical protein